MKTLRRPAKSAKESVHFNSMPSKNKKETKRETNIQKINTDIPWPLLIIPLNKN